MSQWSGSEYQGPKTHDWEEGMGKFTFPNGVIYEGNFNKGEFHGDGTLIYPNGVSIQSWDHSHVNSVNFKYNLTYLFSIRGVTLQSGTEESSLRATTSSMTISPSRRKIGATLLIKTEASTLRFSRVFVLMASLSSPTILRDPRESQKELTTWVMATTILSSAWFASTKDSLRGN